MKITKMKSGSYRAVVYCGRVEGKPFYKSFTGRDRRDVLYKAQQYLADHGAPTGGTLGAAIDDYIISREPVLSPSSISAYKSILRNLKAVGLSWLRIKLVDLKDEDIQALVSAYSREHSPKSVRNAYGLISSALSQKHVRLAPPVLPQKERPRIHIPSDEDIRALLAACSGTSLEVCILLAAFGTMRRGEICALRYPEDFSGCVAHVSHSLVQAPSGEWIRKAPKTYTSDRYVILPQFVVDKIAALGFVTHMTPNAVSNSFSRLLKKAGVQRCRFHDLRHYSVSRLHAADIGMPDADIMKRGGWSTDYTMKNVYRHTLADQSAAANQKANEVFSRLV